LDSALASGFALALACPVSIPSWTLGGGRRSSSIGPTEFPSRRFNVTHFILLPADPHNHPARRAWRILPRTFRNEVPHVGHQHVATEPREQRLLEILALRGQ
jgi:hypothetical protein